MFGRVRRGGKPKLPFYAGLAQLIEAREKSGLVKGRNSDYFLLQEHVCFGLNPKSGTNVYVLRSSSRH